MNKEIEEKTIQKRTVLITTVLSVVASIAFLVLLIQLAINETTAVPLPTLMAVGLVGLLAGMFITGAWLCRNGRITAGLLTVGVGLLLVILAIPFVTQGRSIYASPLAVALVVAIAPQLFSIQMANRVVTIFVVAGLISIALDAWLPFSRITPNAPPFAIYIFIAALFIFIFYTA